MDLTYAVFFYFRRQSAQPLVSHLPIHTGLAQEGLTVLPVFFPAIIIYSDLKLISTLHCLKSNMLEKIPLRHIVPTPWAPHLKKWSSESQGILQLFLIFNLMSFI